MPASCIIGVDLPHEFNLCNNNIYCTTSLIKNAIPWYVEHNPHSVLKSWGLCLVHLYPTLSCIETSSGIQQPIVTKTILFVCSNAWRLYRNAIILLHLKHMLSDCVVLIIKWNSYQTSTLLVVLAASQFLPKRSFKVKGFQNKMGLSLQISFEREFSPLMLLLVMLFAV